MTPTRHEDATGRSCTCTAAASDDEARTLAWGCGPRMHPNTKQLLAHFNHSHLPEELAVISRRFWRLAHELAVMLDGPELTAALRKLLEAKDCAVRAKLPADRDIEWPDGLGHGQ